MASEQPVKENPEDIQEEERLEDAMEHLKLLHLQVITSHWHVMTVSFITDRYH
jgi:hypothetical protein